MGKELTEELKKQISELYRSSDMTNYEIAKTLDVSPRSVRRHKDYGYPQDSSSISNERIESSNIQPEAYNQNIESRQEIEQEDQDIDSENESEQFEQENETIIEQEEVSEKRSYEYVEVLECPSCGSSKDEWITSKQAREGGYPIPEKYERFYKYVCVKNNCNRLIPEKRLQVPGTCPECGSTSIDWIPSEKSKVSEEIKRVSDFICLNCWNPIKISDQ